MNKVSLPYHSFVDLITNSSSESYITATGTGIATLKAIVEKLFEPIKQKHGLSESYGDYLYVGTSYENAYVGDFVEELSEAEEVEFNYREVNGKYGPESTITLDGIDYSGEEMTLPNDKDYYPQTYKFIERLGIGENGDRPNAEIYTIEIVNVNTLKSLYTEEKAGQIESDLKSLVKLFSKINGLFDSDTYYS